MKLSNKFFIGILSVGILFIAIILSYNLPSAQAGIFDDPERYLSIRMVMFKVFNFPAGTPPPATTPPPGQTPTPRATPTPPSQSIDAVVTDRATSQENYGRATFTPGTGTQIDLTYTTSGALQDPEEFVAWLEEDDGTWTRINMDGGPQQDGSYKYISQFTAGKNYVTEGRLLLITTEQKDPPTTTPDFNRVAVDAMIKITQATPTPTGSGQGQGFLQRFIDL
ncbi:MAG: hypothetical protein ACE5DQ_01405 [Candidatus Paceibacterota bacterium]